MKVDLSTVVVVLLFVAPGYLAYWTRNKLAPRQLFAKGSTEELAGFVVISAVVHCLLCLLCGALVICAGLIEKQNPLFFLQVLDATSLESWPASHPVATLGCVLLYFVLSCSVGLLLGIPLALQNLAFHTSRFASLERTKIGLWFKRQGVRGILSEHPLIYTALRPGLDREGTQNLVFIEAELRESRGFYIGQVASYSVSEDEEPHKMVLLKDAQYSPDASTDYGVIQPELILLDLADVLILKIRQIPQDEVKIAPSE